MSLMEQTGAANIADSADEVRLRVREQLLQGASQIKLVGGGGVSSPRTTLDMLTFSEPELRAGVEAAADRNTYVAVHAYPPAAIERAIAARRSVHRARASDGRGDRQTDGGQGRLAQHSAVSQRRRHRSPQRPKPASTASGHRGHEHALSVGERATRSRPPSARICCFRAQKATRQGIMLTHLKRWYENAEILRMATATNGELLALSGPRNPYPGKLGVIEEGALADLLVVDGDPIADIALVEKPDTNLAMIMKGGRIYKNTVEG